MTAEQWMQVFAIIVPVIGMFATMTWFLASRIERGAEGVKSIASMVAVLAPKVDDLLGRVSASEARLNNLERQIDWHPR